MVLDSEVDVVLSDLKMFFPGGDEEFGGFDFLSRLRERVPGLPVIIISAFGTSERALEAMRRGAFDFVEKPVLWDHLRLVIEKAWSTRVQFLEETRPQTRPRQQRQSGDAITAAHPNADPVIPGEAREWMLATLGTSRAMASVRETLQSRPPASNVLLQGEVGVGKEYLARALHYAAGQATRTFEIVACQDGPAGLDGFDLDRLRELAARSTPSRRLTFFLDGVEHLSKPMQEALLKLGAFKGVAELRPFVFISACGVSLAEAVVSGRFHRDLLDRLAEVTIQVPPLRERQDGNDLPLMIGHFLRKHGQSLGVDPSLAADAVAALLKYPFPGNVRELESIIRTAVSSRRDVPIALADIRPLLVHAAHAFQGQTTSPETRSNLSVFLCHNSKAKPEVRLIAEKLRRRGIRPWLDEKELRPGVNWRKVLEEQIETVDCAAVFLDGSGIGPWQDLEVDALLRQMVKRGCPVIPVILGGLNGPPPRLPAFLESMMWVDFRSSRPDPFDQLVWGICGKP